MGLILSRRTRSLQVRPFTFEDLRFDYGEQRFVTIGLLDGVVVIVHTETTE